VVFGKAEMEGTLDVGKRGRPCWASEVSVTCLIRQYAAARKVNDFLKLLAFPVLLELLIYSHARSFTSRFRASISLIAFKVFSYTF